MSTPPALRPGRLLLLLGALSFASGAPWALVNDTAALLYRANGVDLKAVGLLSILSWIWGLKVLVAPAVDRVATRRAWMVATQAGLAVGLVLVALLPASEVTATAWVLFVLLALLSATQDLAVDAYAVDVVPPHLVGPASGVRTLGYRVALVVAGGTLLARAGTLGWSGIWQVAAVAFALAAVLCLRVPPAPRAAAPDTSREALFEGARRLVRRPGAWAFLVFVALFKLGDQAMAPMTKPFLLDRGLSLQVLGDLVTPLMIVATVAGALVGGWATRRWGVLAALASLGAAQAVSNLAYALAAAADGNALLWVAAAVEPLCGGLGTAPFVGLCMLSCERGHAAMQFALLTTVFGLIGRPMGAFSGWGVEALGYGGWFVATFFLALPAFVFLPAVRAWLAAPPAPPPGPTVPA